MPRLPRVLMLALPLGACTRPPVPAPAREPGPPPGPVVRAKYPYRSVMIDLARKYHTLDQVKEAIDLAAHFQLSAIHLHLSDDQLFMFPSQVFPRAGRTNAEFARYDPRSISEPRRYTVAEMKDLVEYARRKRIELIPEIDLPGHSRRLIADAGDEIGIPGNRRTLNIADPKVTERVTRLWLEVMEIFKHSRHVHLGGDEVILRGLEATKEFRASGEKSAKDLYHRFIQHLSKVALQRGKRPIVWEEAFAPGGKYPLPKQTIVMSWNRANDPNRVIEAGYDVINATWTPLYIVRERAMPIDVWSRWSVHEFGAEGVSDYLTLQDSTLKKKGAGKLLGAQICSWENVGAAELQQLGRRIGTLAARTVDGLEGDQTALVEERLAKFYAKRPVVTVNGQPLREEPEFDAPATVELSGLRNLGFRYTLDNMPPSLASEEYTGPISVNRTCFLRAQAFGAGGSPDGREVGAWIRIKGSDTNQRRRR